MSQYKSEVHVGNRILLWPIPKPKIPGTETVPEPAAETAALQLARRRFGWYHGLALKADGTVAAWGYNWDGEASVLEGLSTRLTDPSAADFQRFYRVRRW